VKIYKKALKISKDYLSDNEQLIQNLTRVVNSATGQIEDQKRSYLESRKTRYDREFSESKKEIYKDFQKHADRLKNLPKLRVSRDSHLHSSVEPMQRAEKTHGSMYERNFATRKHPRYYKSYAVTPSNDDSSLQDASVGEDLVRPKIPVSEGLQDFSGGN
jgi:rubrerythrin